MASSGTAASQEQFYGMHTDKMDELKRELTQEQEQANGRLT